MDIAAISMNTAQAAVISKVQTAMLKKTMEQANQQSQALLAALPALNPQVGGKIDISV